jgi:hypothetical protein
MLKKSASGVLSPVSPCDVPSGYASVAPLPAALLDGLFEHHAKTVLYYTLPTFLFVMKTTGFFWNWLRRVRRWNFSSPAIETLSGGTTPTCQ